MPDDRLNALVVPTPDGAAHGVGGQNLATGAAASSARSADGVDTANVRSIHPPLPLAAAEHACARLHPRHQRHISSPFFLDCEPIPPPLRLALAPSSCAPRRATAPQIATFWELIIHTVLEHYGREIALEACTIIADALEAGPRSRAAQAAALGARYLGDDAEVPDEGDIWIRTAASREPTSGTLLRDAIGRCWEFFWGAPYTRFWDKLIDSIKYPGCDVEDEYEEYLYRDPYLYEVNYPTGYDLCRRIAKALEASADDRGLREVERDLFVIGGRPMGRDWAERARPRASRSSFVGDGVTPRLSSVSASSSAEVGVGAPRGEQPRSMAA